MLAMGDDAWGVGRWWAVMGDDVGWWWWWVVIEGVVEGEVVDGGRGVSHSAYVWVGGWVAVWVAVCVIFLICISIRKRRTQDEKTYVLLYCTALLRCSLLGSLLLARY